VVKRWVLGLVTAALILIALLIDFTVNKLASGQQTLTVSIAVLCALAVVGAGVEVVRKRSGRAAVAPLPAMIHPPSWAVGRPAELDSVVAAVVRRRTQGTVAITTGVLGVGGFGKTVLAQMVCVHPAVRKQFGGRIYWVGFGRDISAGADIAGRVNDLIGHITGTRPSYSEPGAAGQELARAVASHGRTLVVIDDVWTPQQLDPFLTAGTANWVLLLTTRIPSLLPDDASRITVDALTARQAEAVLMADGTLRLPDDLVEGLLKATGRWALLLRLLNRYLYKIREAGGDVTASGRRMLARLESLGPTAIDDVSAFGHLDVDDPAQRQRAVGATIEASTSLLPAGGADRLAELGIFAEDERVPVRLVMQLWAATSGLGEQAAEWLYLAMAELSLLTLASDSVELHDVVRSHLRHHELGTRLADVNRTLLLAPSADLSTPEPLVPEHPCAEKAWWELPCDQDYLWDHLISHLIDADLASEAAALATDLRWITARLQNSGPGGAIADVSRVAELPAEQADRASEAERIDSLARLLARSSHLISASDFPGGITSTIVCMFQNEGMWKESADNYASSLTNPVLLCRWPLADVQHPALQRVFPGEGLLNAMAISPDGKWVASGSSSTARIWDARTGRLISVLTGHQDTIFAIAISPDGSWLATASSDKTVRLWDAATGEQIAKLTARMRQVHKNDYGFWQYRGGTLAISPDGSWLAASGVNRQVRIWDVRERRLVGRFSAADTGIVRALAISPDGSWLATGGDDPTVRIWDIATRSTVASLDTGEVLALAVSPDGSWLAAAGSIGKVLTWNAETWQIAKTLTAHTPTIRALAVSPDGSWLAAAGGGDYGDYGGGIRLWDAVTGQPRDTLTGYFGTMRSLAFSPDGSWLASGETDGAVWTWSTRRIAGSATSTGSVSAVNVVAISPDGTWVAHNDSTGTVYVRDAVTRDVRVTLKGQHEFRNVLAVSSDGAMLATIERDLVQIWDLPSGRLRHSFDPPQTPIVELVFDPDDKELTAVDWDGGQVFGTRVAENSAAPSRCTITRCTPISAVMAPASCGQA
jgi:WD40 repeat protein